MNDDTSGGRPWRDAWRGSRLLAAVAGMMLLVAACGSGSDKPSSTASSPSVSVQLASYAQCMRGHGVPDFYFSRPGSSAGSTGPALKFPGGWIVQGVDTSAPKYQSAQKACGHLLPASAPLVLSVSAVRRMIKAAACMRAHGYPDWPDPVMENGAPFTQIPSGIDTNSPQFQSAQKTCHPEM
jgi:hypothetical protein